MSSWINLDDKAPALEGYYWCVIQGNSEIMDGRTIYQYPDYMTLMFFYPKTPVYDRDIWTGEHDEDADEIICWWDERIVRPEMPAWEGE